MGDGLRWMKVRVSERALSSCICEEMICNPISPHLAAATSCTNISLKLGSRETARLTSQGPEHDSDCCYALLPAVCVCVCVWYLSPQREKRHCGDRTPHRCMLGVRRLAELCVAPEKHTPTGPTVGQCFAAGLKWKHRVCWKHGSPNTPDVWLFILQTVSKQL